MPNNKPWWATPTSAVRPMGPIPSLGGPGKPLKKRVAGLPAPKLLNGELKGMGINVQDFQKFANTKGLGLTVDNKYGPSTAKAYKQWGDIWQSDRQTVRGNPQGYDANYDARAVKPFEVAANLANRNPVIPQAAWSGITPTNPVDPRTSDPTAPPVSYQLANKPAGVFDWGRVKDFMSTAKPAIESTLPWASNVANAFRRPPPAPMPTMDAEIAANHVNLDSERSSVEQQTRMANIAAERSLDENTATAVRSGNRAQGMQYLSGVNERERNANIGIDNENTRLNAAVRAGNNAKRDGYANTVAERTMAIQSEQGANLANAADKFIAKKQTDAATALEERKMDILRTSDLYGTLGNATAEDKAAQLQKKKDAEILRIRNRTYNTGKMKSVYGRRS